MKTVKINREFVEMFYFCPQLAYIQFFGQKKIFDVNKKPLTFNKFSDFTDEFYLHKMYTKILTFIFFNHKETGTIEYDFIVNLVSQFLNEETNKRYDKYNEEILKNVKPIIKMFEPKDSILIKHNTIKDKLDLTKHMEKYFSGQPEPIFDKVLLNKEKKFVYEIEIPFIITENNSTQSCVPILFVNKEIENCCNPYDINSLLTMLYIKENSFYHIFNKVIFYDFKSFKRTMVEVEYEYISKVREIIRMLSQATIHNFIRNNDPSKCSKCGNLEFCKSYNILKSW